MAFQHQDWNPVILKKTSKPTKTSSTLGKKPPQEGDEFKLAKVGKDLKIAIMQARLLKKMSQKDLANRCGVGIDIIQKYESGKIIPNNKFVVKLEKILGTSLPRITKPKKDTNIND